MSVAFKIEHYVYSRSTSYPNLQIHAIVTIVSRKPNSRYLILNQRDPLNKIKENQLSRLTGMRKKQKKIL